MTFYYVYSILLSTQYEKNHYSINTRFDGYSRQGAKSKLNELEYFERQGVNILVFSNSFNGGFNDEKNSGIEIIHHGVRTIQGGAVRLNNTPEQWDLVPTMTSRKVDTQYIIFGSAFKNLQK